MWLYTEEYKQIPNTIAQTLHKLNFRNMYTVKDLFSVDIVISPLFQILDLNWANLINIHLYSNLCRY